MIPPNIDVLCKCHCHQTCVEVKGHVLYAQLDWPLFSDPIAAMQACSHCQLDHDQYRAQFGARVVSEPSPKPRKIA